MNVVLKNLTAGKDLYAELKDLVESEVNTEKLLEIILEKGDYTLSNSLDFKCNLIIRGNGAKIRATELANISTDDTLIAVKGKNPDLMLKVEVYDTEFDIKSGLVATTKDGVDISRFYFKLYYCDKVIFQNVRIELYNHCRVTNIDLRRCSNVAIKDCLLFNFNNFSEGGVLWLRGETNNVVISGNTFRKHGNDEVIAIWGDGNISEVEVNSITKRNIQIINNAFEYGETSAPSYGIDKYIALYDSRTYRKEISLTTGNLISYPVDNREYTWENVIIANNMFQLADLVNNLIHVSFGAKNTIVNNFKINNNVINHSGYVVEQYVNSSEQTAFERDFTIVSQSDADVVVSVNDNIVTASHTVYSGTNFYVNLQIKGGVKVNYVGNQIDAAEMPRLYDSSGNLETFGIIVMEIADRGEVIMCNNNIVGSYLLGKCYKESSSGSFLVQLKIYDNSFEGSNWIYCSNVDDLTASVYDNEFVTERGILLFQNFGANGNLFVCNNIWKKSQTYNGNVRIYYPDANFSVPSIQKLIIVGNDFTDFLESQVVLNNLPDANVKVVDGNTY